MRDMRRVKHATSPGVSGFMKRRNVSVTAILVGRPLRTGQHDESLGSRVRPTHCRGRQQLRVLPGPVSQVRRTWCGRSMARLDDGRRGATSRSDDGHGRRVRRTKRGRNVRTSRARCGQSQASSDRGTSHGRNSEDIIYYDRTRSHTSRDSRAPYRQGTDASASSPATTHESGSLRSRIGDSTALGNCARHGHHRTRERRAEDTDAIVLRRWSNSQQSYNRSTRPLMVRRWYHSERCLCTPYSDDPTHSSG